MFCHRLGYPGILVLGTGFIEGGRQRLTTSSWIWLSQNLPERTFLLKARGESPQYHKACAWNPEHFFEHLIYGTIHCTSRLILLPFSKNIYVSFLFNGVSMKPIPGFDEDLTFPRSIFWNYGLRFAGELWTLGVSKVPPSRWLKYWSGEASINVLDHNASCILIDEIDLDYCSWSLRWVSKWVSLCLHSCPPIWNIQICQSIDARLWLQWTLIVNSMCPGMLWKRCWWNTKTRLNQFFGTSTHHWLAHASQLVFPPLLSSHVRSDHLICGDDKMRIKSKRF